LWAENNQSDGFVMDPSTDTSWDWLIGKILVLKFSSWGR